VLLGLMGISISNIVMFGLILAVGMLVDGAIVVVEYADKRIREGSGPMHAYVEAAKRMFWPIVSSTATTLCAFLPMLFWPGVPGEFMGMLPVTLIFVLSASLIVALVYLPVMGGVAGRMSRLFERGSARLMFLPWGVRALLAAASAYLLFVAIMQVLNPSYILPQGTLPDGIMGTVVGGVMFILAAFVASVTLGAAQIKRKPKRIRAGYRRNGFGWFIHMIVGNPVMPLVAIGVVGFAVVTTFTVFGANNRGVEFFVESEPEQAIIYVRARGNLSLHEKDALLARAEAIVMADPAVQSTFAFAGEGGLNQNTGGAMAPLDTVGQMQIELIPWEERPALTNDLGLTSADPGFDGDLVLDRLEANLATLPGIQIDILAAERGPSSGKPVHLRLTGDDREMLAGVTREVRAHMETLPGLIDFEDTLPLPRIDWQINVDVEKAGRYGANVATVGAMVQLVTRGLLLDTMRVDSSDEEIEIRVRLPQKDRVLSTLDSLKVRTPGGLVPLSNFVTREPVPNLGQIDRVDQSRYFDIKADVAPGLTNDAGQPITANERIEVLTAWLDDGALPAGVGYEWTGDQEEQAESQAFLQSAFMGALGLMFVILLAQFNSVYNSVLVLLAVVLSTAGVLVGMLVMQQPFSIIMTGTGIVALAGIVVNNNIVLIDTYQEYSKSMPRLEAITRTAQARIRPVLLTTITTMAGLAPMMFGLSLDFFNGGSSIDSPTALWWKQLATAVVFGLGIATVLTLLFTPAMLALRYWAVQGAYGAAVAVRAGGFGRAARRTRADWRLTRSARKLPTTQIIWDDGALDTDTAEGFMEKATPPSEDQQDQDSREDEDITAQDIARVLEQTGKGPKLIHQDTTDAAGTDADTGTDPAPDTPKRTGKDGGKVQAAE